MLICVCHVESYLLTYLPTYLLNLSQHYDRGVDVICNSSFARFCNTRLLEHLFYSECLHMCNKYCNLFYCSIEFILLHMKPQLKVSSEKDST